ncbi:hypothetical protein SKAU_G00060180 [Synaphobranchus kaupii]|uniref:Uncharacterized protein n=1 Tax=Synaphobranchus kaupii TaxID=118154 RepID=A0A9Q1JA97_SYNKA|nr:hypothetical protein SKAU_G00060180 [Synaphobranchus kaupii]
MLTVTRYKMQLIDLICEDMASHKDDFTQHKLVLTGRDPVEINSGVIIKCQDMKTTEEEADTMIVQQVAEVKTKKVLVVADDTDIFVLLLHFCCQDLLAAHGLTGCDTVATYFGIGKAVALRVLRAGVHALSDIGDTIRVLSEFTSQATPFILACYGQPKCTSLTEARQKMWASKVGRSVAGAPKLASLPPQMRHSRKMWPALTFRWQSGGMHCNQIHREWIQHLDGHGKMAPKCFSQQLFPVTSP